MALYGNPSLAFEIHIVKRLFLEVSLTHSSSNLEQSIGQSAFTVVNMRYNTEVSDVLHALKNWQ
jgi:hypothetical protein